MDYIAMAETLEAQAASLRREHARLAAAELPQLPLGDGWRAHPGGDHEQPPETYGKNVDVKDERTIWTGPAAAVGWTMPCEWRLSAEQPATE